MYLRAAVPEAVEPLQAMEERLSTGGREPCRHACSSGRELLCLVADSVFPASTDTRDDVWGRPHQLTQDKCINRLVAFVEDELGSETESWERRAMGAKLYSAWRRMNDDGLHRRLPTPEMVEQLENQLAEAYLELLSGLALVARAGMNQLHRQAVASAVA